MIRVSLRGTALVSLAAGALGGTTVACSSEPQPATGNGGDAARARVHELGSTPLSEDCSVVMGQHSASGNCFVEEEASDYVSWVCCGNPWDTGVSAFFYGWGGDHDVVYCASTWHPGINADHCGGGC
jgi:hypothetical protein